MWIRNTLLETKGQGFEDVFTQSAKLRWGEDFEPWKPQGRYGDFKCDGYLVSGKRVFQCHGPESAEPAKTATKIVNDFEGAKQHFGNRMESWVFVYNHRDIPAGCGKLLGDLRDANPSITIVAWTQTDVLKHILELGSKQLAILLPGWRKEIGVGDDLRTAMTAMLENEKPANEDVGQEAVLTSQPTLNQALSQMSEEDRAIRIRLMGYSKWFDPLGRARASGLLTDKGFAADSIVTNLDRLHQERFLRITREHILPLNHRICQDAADELTDEFIKMLEDM